MASSSTEAIIARDEPQGPLAGGRGGLSFGVGVPGLRRRRARPAHEHRRAAAADREHQEAADHAQPWPATGKRGSSANG
jgi:hypothetical protein